MGIFCSLRLSTRTLTKGYAMQTKLLINGQLVDGEGTCQPVYNPSLGTVLVDIAEASTRQVEAAVLAADQAFEGWAQTPPKTALSYCSSWLIESRSRQKPWPAWSHSTAASLIRPR